MPNKYKLTTISGDCERERNQVLVPMSSPSSMETVALKNMTKSHAADNSDAHPMDSSSISIINAAFPAMGNEENKDGAVTQKKPVETSQGDPAKERGEPELNSLSIKCCVVFVWIKLVRMALYRHRQLISTVVNKIILLLFLAYCGYALYRQWGTESATRLWLLLIIVLWVSVVRHVIQKLRKRLPRWRPKSETILRLKKIIRVSLYLVAGAGAVVYLVLEVTPYRPRNLLSLAGIAFLLLIGLLMSAHPERVNWHTVFWGFSIQFYLAIFLLRTQVGQEMFEWLGDRLQEFIKYTDVGSEVIFGKAYVMHPFAFQSMPMILFVNSVIAAGYFFGFVQAFIATFGRFLAWCLDTSPIESVNAAANIFLGLAEAPLFIKPYLDRVSDSELFAIMTGGFASISGGLIGSLVSYGIPAKHLMAASVMSAPAALAVAKLMCPDKPGDSTISADQAYTIDFGQSKNLLEAMSRAAMAGVTIAVTVCANILVCVAILTFADRTLEWFGDQVGIPDFSFSRLLSYLFYPLMYLFGVDPDDLLTMGRLVGVKTFTNTILGYVKAGELISNSQTFHNYTAVTNGSWHFQGDDIVLDLWSITLVGGILTERSIVISTYILCGFSNLSSMGICIGSLSALAPKRTPDIIKHVLSACIAGNIACFMTGCVAGLLYI